MFERRNLLKLYYLEPLEKVHTLFQEAGGCGLTGAGCGGFASNNFPKRLFPAFTRLWAVLDVTLHVSHRIMNSAWRITVVLFEPR